MAERLDETAIDVRVPLSTDGRYRESHRLLLRAQQSVAGGVNSGFRASKSPSPIFFRRAAGAHLIDEDGNDYIDYVLGMGPCILGHAPKPVVAAVAETLSSGQLFAGQHRHEVDLAEQICSLVPSAELVRLGQSGSEMIQAALRAARAVSGRQRVVKFEGHYHGWLDPIYVGVVPTNSGPKAMVPATDGQALNSIGDMDVLPWNDTTALRDFMASHGAETAAVVMEPILCNTGVIPPTPAFLAAARRLCDEHGCLLIFDEVITGFRISPGGAQSKLGVLPDLAVFAKALGGGFPIAALVGSRAAMQPIAEGRSLHGGTYNANVPSVVAAQATLTALTQDQDACYRQMERIGDQLMTGLRSIAERLGIPLRVQGYPTVFNTFFSDDDSPVINARQYVSTDIPRQQAFVRALHDGGIRVTTRGTWFLSAAHDGADIDRTLDVVEAALAEPLVVHKEAG